MITADPVAPTATHWKCSAPSSGPGTPPNVSQVSRSVNASGAHILHMRCLSARLSKTVGCTLYTGLYKLYTKLCWCQCRRVEGMLSRGRSRVHLLASLLIASLSARSQCTAALKCVATRRFLLPFESVFSSSCSARGASSTSDCIVQALRRWLLMLLRRSRTSRTSFP
jgi:hypothetical protein